MENLKIPNTKYTLGVNFDVETGILEMSGTSYPENAIDYFQKIFDWIKTYMSNQHRPIVLNLKLDYLNTSSTKCILDILELLEQYYKNGNDVVLNWYYAEDDEDILETGKEFAEDIDLPLNFISY